MEDKFNGLQGGRLVNYVTRSGYIRPLLVLVAWQNTAQLTGKVNGIVFRDGSNDDAEFPKPEYLSLSAGSDGGNVIIPPPSVRLAEWAASVEYNEDHAPGTWHWPTTKTAAVFVTVEQLNGMLQQHEEAVEGAVVKRLADLLKSPEFVEAVALADLENQKALQGVEGLPPEIQELNTLKADVKRIFDILNHHGLNGPAAKEAEQAALPGVELEKSATVATISAPITGDSIVQTPGHPPQSGTQTIGKTSIGGNDGKANAAALEKNAGQ